jgi:hypothetical protein
VTNRALISKPYVVGEAGKPQTAVGHTGELGSFLTSYWTVPEEKTGVLVFSNTFNIHGDPTNLISQLLLQALFDYQPRIDFTAVTDDIIANAAKRWDESVKQWEAGRTQGTSPRDLSCYEGSFSNLGLGLTIDVRNLENPHALSHHGSVLTLQLNEEPDQSFEMYHYDHDRWTFMPDSYDECLKHGYSTYADYWPTFVVAWTESHENGSLSAIEWAMDADTRVPPVVFHRTAPL